MIASTAPKTVKTVAALALALERSERMVHIYLSRGMDAIAKTPSGRYSVAKCRAWIAEHIPPPNGSDRAVPDSELNVAIKRAELAKTEAQAKAIDLKNAILEGRLVDREEIELRAGEMGARIRQRLESVADEMQMSFPPELRQELTSEVARHMENVLREMSAWQFIDEEKT